MKSLCLNMRKVCEMAGGRCVRICLRAQIFPFMVGQENDVDY